LRLFGTICLTSQVDRSEIATRSPVVESESLGYLETELFMAVLLTTHKALQRIQKLSFCYFCSRELSSQEAINRDHVPPSGLFAFADWDLPLILPTHAACNFSQSQDDQVIGQLVGLLHGRSPNPMHNKLNISLVQLEGGSPTAALAGMDIRATIRRWIRAFHAALYGEPLPETAMFSTYPPVPEVKPERQAVKPLPIPEVFPDFVEALKRNRTTKTLDRIL
jgi:hypothetical protein